MVGRAICWCLRIFHDECLRTRSVVQLFFLVWVGFFFGLRWINRLPLLLTHLSSFSPKSRNPSDVRSGWKSLFCFATRAQRLVGRDDSRSYFYRARRWQQQGGAASPSPRAPSAAVTGSGGRDEVCQKAIDNSFSNIRSVVSRRIDDFLLFFHRRSACENAFRRRSWRCKNRTLRFVHLAASLATIIVERIFHSSRSLKVDKKICKIFRHKINFWVETLSRISEKKIQLKSYAILITSIKKLKVIRVSTKINFFMTQNYFQESRITRTKSGQVMTQQSRLSMLFNKSLFENLAKIAFRPKSINRAAPSTWFGRQVQTDDISARLADVSVPVNGIGQRMPLGQFIRVDDDSLICVHQPVKLKQLKSALPSRDSSGHSQAAQNAI